LLSVNRFRPVGLRPFLDQPPLQITPQRLRGSLRERLRDSGSDLILPNRNHLFAPPDVLNQRSFERG